jgi:hypothetical protein
MTTSLGEVVEYSLSLGEGEVLDLNAHIGGRVEIEFQGTIHCVFCGKLTPKSYGGGSCYQCLQSLPQNDMCQMKPELCHLDRGTCRDADWGRSHCETPHVVYLARSSAVKVGITRENPTETRWMDQGAIEGMVIAEVPDRKTSGMIETALSQHMADKTDFRKMLRGEIADDDLEEVFQEMVDHVPPHFQSLLLEERVSKKIAYPLNSHPAKIKTLSLDKMEKVGGSLVGIKGQYLIFEEGVFNVRGHTGYDVKIEVEEGTGFQASESEEPVNLFDLMG